MAINPVKQAPQTDDADENDSVWTLLVLNKSWNSSKFDFLSNKSWFLCNYKY